MKISNNISVDNRIEWSPIQFVIIQVINKIWWLQGGSSILLIIHVITDRTWQHKVLSPINQNYHKISETN